MSRQPIYTPHFAKRHTPDINLIRLARIRKQIMKNMILCRHMCCGVHKFQDQNMLGRPAEISQVRCNWSPYACWLDDAFYTQFTWRIGPNRVFEEEANLIMDMYTLYICLCETHLKHGEWPWIGVHFCSKANTTNAHTHTNIHTVCLITAIPGTWDVKRWKLSSLNFSLKFQINFFFFYFRLKVCPFKSHPESSCN